MCACQSYTSNTDLGPCVPRSSSSQIQNNKQKSSGLKRKIDDVLEELKPPEVSSVRLNSRWNNEELMLAVQGVRMYGRDFQVTIDTFPQKQWSFKPCENSTNNPSKVCVFPTHISDWIFLSFFSLFIDWSVGNHPRTAHTWSPGFSGWVSPLLPHPP